MQQYPNSSPLTSEVLQAPELHLSFEANVDAFLSAPASISAPLNPEKGEAVEPPHHEQLWQDTTPREMSFLEGEADGTSSAIKLPTSSGTNRDTGVDESLTCGSSLSANGISGQTNYTSDRPSSFPLTSENAETERKSYRGCVPSVLDNSTQADCLGDIEIEPPPDPAPGTEKEHGETDTAKEITELKELVATLQQENKHLQELLRARSPWQPAASGGTAPSEPGCPLEENPLSLPSQSAAECPLVSHNEDIRTATAGDAPKARKAKAPGAPPPSRGPRGKAQGVPPPPGSAGPSCTSGMCDSTLSRWGWCHPREPLSSLRSCCADHLLLEGACVPAEGTRGREGVSGGCSVEPSLRGPMDVAWLLDLEATVQTALKDSPPEQQQSPRSTVGSDCSRDALRSLVEEIGFSVLETAGEGVDGCAIKDDTRLVEWFRRSKVPPKASLNLKPAGIASFADAATSAASKQQLVNCVVPLKHETASLPASLRKSISISLSALRRGCPDRLNFFKRLQADILQCSLNTSAIELLLELVPDMTAPSDRRQLWLDARQMLASREHPRKPFDDEEAFTAFVLEFGAFHQRLELLLFLNGKHMESQLSSLLVQVQLKLDCLAMLRRRAPRIARCFKAVSVAASIVSDIPQCKCSSIPGGETTNPEKPQEDKENNFLGGDEKAADTKRALPHISGSFPIFRWPLLFQMVETHYGFSADGGTDRSRSLLKVLGSHVGNTLDVSEVTLLRRAAQKPLVALLEQHASLVHALLYLHRAASRASSAPSTAAEASQQGTHEHIIEALATRLRQCCHLPASSDSSGDAADGVKDEGDDLLLKVIPRLVANHKPRLETLARLVAQLLREYAAFICWMGDRRSFLPVQLHLQGTGSKKEQQAASQTSTLPAILATCLPSSRPQEGSGSSKLDAFSCLSTFLEKLSYQAGSPADNRPIRKHLLQRRDCTTCRGLSSPTSSSTSSLPMHSPGSSPETRKQQKTRSAFTLSSAAPPRLPKVRCLPLPSGSNGDAPSGLRALLSRASASLRSLSTESNGSAAPRESTRPGRSAVPLYAVTESPHLLSRVLHFPTTAPTAPPLEKLASPFRRASPPHGRETTSIGCSVQAGRELLIGTPGNLLAGPRLISAAASDGNEPPTCTPDGPVLEANRSGSTSHMVASTATASQTTGKMGDTCTSPYSGQVPAGVRNPSEFSRGSFASVLCSSNPLTSGVRVSFENGSIIADGVSSGGQNQ